MGLDAVELIMEVEAAFDLRIPDADAEQLKTVGSLSGYVWDRLGIAGDAPCATARSFYRLRQGIVEICGVPRRHIRPGTRLKSLFPADRRVRPWNVLRARLPGLPALEATPRSVSRMIRCSGAGFILGATFGAAQGVAGFHLLGGVVMGLMGALAGGTCALPFYIASTRHLPASCTTVGDASLLLATTLDDEPLGLTRRAVDLRVRTIVADVLGARIEDVHPHSRFVEDLGAD